MKDSLWGIVNGSEAAPGLATDADRALALKWRAVTIGDPEDPVEVWRKLSHTFQKKTWANKLELRQKLYTLGLRDGESVQQHIKEMTEIFDSLAVIGNPISEEDQVVQSP